MGAASRTGHDGRSPNRAQTGIDFMVGMGVFLLAVGFVFGFAPGLFEPFETGTGENMVVSDRAAAALAADVLVESLDQPGVLNATCTVEFFDGDGNVADCRFDTEDLHDALGVESTTDLNATIEDGGTVVTLDSTPLASGAEPGPNRDVIVAKRIVWLDGSERTLVVRVW